MPTPLRALLLTAPLLLPPALAFAQDKDKAKEKEKPADPVAAALGHEIIGPRQAMVEVIELTEANTPRMPEVKSVAEWEAFADRTRREVFEKVIFRGEAASWREAKGRVEWLETIDGGPGYRIKKLRYEAVPGLWIPALLYEPETLSGKVPVVLNVNGHERKGKAVDYKQIRCINQAKRGMIGLNLEWFGMGQFATPEYRHDLINHIDLCGASGIATHYLAMARGIDVLLAHEHADPARVAVTGLSGGGWQTIFISSFDTRVTLTDPVAGYSSFRTRVKFFSDLGDSEQTPCDLATVTDYAVMTALMAPRPTLLTFNAKDNCCFAAGHALEPLKEAAGPIFQLYGKPENLRSHVNEDPGDHNYGLDNRQALYQMLGDHFFAGAKDFDPKEIPSEPEVKSKEALDVTLPVDNASLHSLALDLSKTLPRDPALPREKGAAVSWRDDRRERLRAVVRAVPGEAQATKTGSDDKEGVRATYWRLNVGGWSVPVVELTRGEAEPKGTTLLVADEGRKAAAERARALLDHSNGGRVLAVDPLGIGEAKFAEKGDLFALMIATLGERLLGVQASQLAAVARWARTDRKTGPVLLVADGPRTSVMALVAAGLEDAAIAGLELRGSYGSLKELIEAKSSYAKSPELFCFGLLRDFDILQLAALAAPRPVSFVEPAERATKELAGLKDWYGTWGVDVDPLP
jgi:hypothetical protein